MENIFFFSDVFYFLRVVKISDMFFYLDVVNLFINIRKMFRVDCYRLNFDILVFLSDEDYEILIGIIKD